MEEAKAMFTHSSSTNDIEAARRTIQQHQELKKSKWNKFFFLWLCIVQLRNMSSFILFESYCVLKYLPLGHISLYVLERPKVTFLLFYLKNSV